MSVYIAAYDITRPKNRDAVATVLSRYGHRIQRSVFEVWLDPQEVGELRASVGAHLERSDSFDLLPIDDRGNRPRHRWQRPIELWTPVVAL